VRIGIIAPPFIAVPPARYGGTELFIANLACQLHARGHEVTVYTNGDSRLPCRVRWLYGEAAWPIEDSIRAQFKNADHTAWAIQEAARSVDILHLNDIVGLPFTRFVETPVVHTVHHPHEPVLSEQYEKYPEIDYVLIAHWLAGRETMPKMHVVHHGIPLDAYRFRSAKDDYVAFLGRMAPCKGPHLAIDAARRAGIRIKLAGDIQPIFNDYWQQEVAPRLDGRDAEYIGEADLATKNELLGRARALLFPIQWEEPFGLVMIEAMACGTPVLALAGGSVAEVVTDGVNGWICDDVTDMAARIAASPITPHSCRASVAERFSVERMASDYLDIYEQALSGASPAATRAYVPWKT
jgi:glycosyltransferase involved in cell wall biosynthesis